MIAEENKGLADVISVSDVISAISFTIKPRRAPVPTPRKTRPGTQVAGRMAETIPISEKEHSVNKTVEQVVLEDSSGVLEQGTQELTNSVTNNSVLGEESDSELSESQSGLESNHTILSVGRKWTVELFLKELCKLRHMKQRVKLKSLSHLLLEGLLG